MSENMDLYIQFPPETAVNRNKIFIIDHAYCEVYLDEVIEELCYLLNDENLWDDMKWGNNDDVSRVFVKNMNNVIAANVPYVVTGWAGDIIRDMGKLAGQLKQKGIDWNFVVFYHNDQDTINLFKNPVMRASALEKKADWLRAFSRFPFIKRVEVPAATLIDFRYLEGLFGKTFE
jgi:hypothetical protein